MEESKADKICDVLMLKTRVSNTTKGDGDDGQSRMTAKEGQELLRMCRYDTALFEICVPGALVDFSCSSGPVGDL